MTTMQAHWSESPTPHNIGSAGGALRVSSATDVDQLVVAIAEFPAEAAIIYHEDRAMTPNPFVEGDTDIPDHELVVGVSDGWGYIRIWTTEDDGIWQLDGDPGSPEYVRGESEFPAGAGLPVAEVVEALNEFLATARRPECVKWTPE